MCELMFFYWAFNFTQNFNNSETPALQLRPDNDRKTLWLCVHTDIFNLFSWHWNIYTGQNNDTCTYTCMGHAHSYVDRVTKVRCLFGCAEFFKLLLQILTLQQSSIFWLVFIFYLLQQFVNISKCSQFLCAK